jgi:protein-tyrosine phosphatase
MFQRILTVCTGNICRSPLAEALLRDRLTRAGQSAEVRSAGTGALSGHPADPITQELAAEQGISLDEHTAFPITTTLTRWADLILTMEHAHQTRLIELDPTARGKVFLLGHWQDREITDPYRRDHDVYREVQQQILEGVESWVPRL